MFDFLKPKILEEVDSKYSGRVKVVQNLSDVYIATGPLTQSGGLVREVWQPAFKNLISKNAVPGSCLILGLAGGTIARLCTDYFHPAKIVGVEIDPEMIRLGKKYLNLESIPNLEIVVKDAKHYLMHLPPHTRFDLILVDMYLGDKLPEFVYSEDFLRRLSQLGRLVIFNHLFYDTGKRGAAQSLVDKLKRFFPNLRLVRKLTNLFIICD